MQSQPSSLDFLENTKGSYPGSTTSPTSVSRHCAPLKVRWLHPKILHPHLRLNLHCGESNPQLYDVWLLRSLFLPYSVHDFRNQSCISTCSLHYVLVIHGFSWLDAPNFPMTGPLQQKKPGLCRSGKGLRTSCLRNITCARADTKRGVDRTKQLSVGLWRTYGYMGRIICG